MAAFSPSIPSLACAEVVDRLRAGTCMVSISQMTSASRYWLPPRALASPGCTISAIGRRRFVQSPSSRRRFLVNAQAKYGSRVIAKQKDIHSSERGWLLTSTTPGAFIAYSVGPAIAETAILEKAADVDASLTEDLDATAATVSEAGSVLDLPASSVDIESARFEPLNAPGEDSLTAIPSASIEEATPLADGDIIGPISSPSIIIPDESATAGDALQQLLPDDVNAPLVPPEAAVVEGQNIQEGSFHFELPELPKFDFPEFDFPTIDLPDVDLPVVPSLTDISNEVTALTQEAVDKVFIPGKAAVDYVVLQLREGREDLISSAISGIDAAVGRFVDSLPPEFVEGVQAFSDAVGAVTGPIKVVLVEYGGPAAVIIKDITIQLALVVILAVKGSVQSLGLDPDDPAVILTLAFFGTLLIGFAYWRAFYAGFAGSLSPEDALKLLRQEDAVLVDVRPEEAREVDGIPDLRRSARFKDAFVEFTRVEGPLRSIVRNADDLDLQLTAAKIRRLKKVNTLTQVVVMDENGSLSRDIARALTKYELLRTYQVDGGYRAWADSLRTKKDAPESLVDILSKEYEAFVEELNPTPFGVAAVLVGVVLTGVAIYEWEYSLQLIAFLGITKTLYDKLTSYESLDDLKQDIESLARPFAAAAAGAAALVSSSSEAKPPLTAEAEEAIAEEATAATSEFEGDGGEVSEGELTEAAAVAAATASDGAPASPTTGADGEAEATRDISSSSVDVLEVSETPVSAAEEPPIAAEEKEAAPFGIAAATMDKEVMASLPTEAKAE